MMTGGGRLLYIAEGFLNRNVYVSRLLTQLYRPPLCVAAKANNIKAFRYYYFIPRNTVRDTRSIYKLTELLLLLLLLLVLPRPSCLMYDTLRQ